MGHNVNVYRNRMCRKNLLNFVHAAKSLNVQVATAFAGAIQLSWLLWRKAGLVYKLL